MSAIVGNRLRIAREEKELSLEEVAASTYIKLKYLRAMEAGDFDALPSEVQARGFLRSYGNYLDLDVDKLLADLERDPILAMTEAEEQPAEEPVFEPPAEGPEALFTQVGQQLQEQRILLGLDLDEVERFTHIKEHYLSALEKGDWQHLPSVVQGRGMLKNYASFLRLDPEPLLLTFADAVQKDWERTQPRARDLERPVRESPRQVAARRLNWFNRDLLIGAVLVIFFVSVVIIGGMRVMDLARDTSTIEPTPPSIAEVLLPTPTETLAPTPTATRPSPIDDEAGNGGGEAAVIEPTEALVPVIGEGQVQVQINVQQRAYMRITADGDVVFNGRVIPGSAYAFAGEESVEILTGNAAALEVLYNGENIGTLGIYGEVVNFVITNQGIQTPTPTVTPTSTQTPTASPTATLEATQSP